MLTESDEKLILPVPPQEFTIQKGNNNQVVTVEGIGELNIIGSAKLVGLSISSFFPSQYYPFCTSKEIKEPYDYVEIIEKWIKTGKPIILNIERHGFYLTCLIENFSYGEKDGSGDVYYTMDIKEYKILRPNIENSGISNSDLRQQTKKPAKTYIVNSGDTLWKIAQREYGNGSKWREIADKNGVKDPKKLQIGQRLVL